MNVERAGLGLLIPTLLNPATATVLAVGAIGYGLFMLLSDDDENEGLVEANGSETQNEPLPTVASTVEPLRATIDQNKEEVSRMSDVSSSGTELGI